MEKLFWSIQASALAATVIVEGVQDAANVVVGVGTADVPVGVGAATEAVGVGDGPAAVAVGGTGGEVPSAV